MKDAASRVKEEAKQAKAREVAEVERIGRLKRRYGMLVDELDLVATLE